MRKLLLRSLVRPPADRGARRRRTRRRWPSSPRAVERRRAQAARPLARDPRGRRRLLQRLRARDPRAEQRLLRPRALRHPLRRLAAPRRRAAGDRPGDQEHARGAGAHLRTRRPTRNGSSRSATARVDGGCFAGSYAVVGGVSEVVPVDLHIRGCPPTPDRSCSRACSRCSSPRARRRRVDRTPGQRSSPRSFRRAAASAEDASGACPKAPLSFQRHPQLGEEAPVGAVGDDRWGSI